nr:hypothetical protein [Nocardia terpenica]
MDIDLATVVVTQDERSGAAIVQGEVLLPFVSKDKAAFSEHVEGVVQFGVDEQEGEILVRSSLLSEKGIDPPTTLHPRSGRVRAQQFEYPAGVWRVHHPIISPGNSGSVTSFALEHSARRHHAVDVSCGNPQRRACDRREQSELLVEQ